MSVRVKKATKATKPARSVRYLLSADRRLQKLSLRKMADRTKKAKQTPRSTQSKIPAGAKPSPRQAWPVSGPAIVLGVICIVGAAALISARQPSPRRDVSAVDAPPEASTSLTSVPVAARLEPTKSVASKPPAPATAPVSKPPEASVPVAKLQPLDVAKLHSMESVKTPVAAESTPNAVVPNVAPVTITGCVELVGGRFWLTDTSGVEAPKSRSWKTGFLKKRPSRIEFVDAIDTLTLPAMSDSALLRSAF
jgi:hypothetical protein